MQKALQSPIDSLIFVMLWLDWKKKNTQAHYKEKFQTLMIPNTTNQHQLLFENHSYTYIYI